jgi:hypothetical protein
MVSKPEFKPFFIRFFKQDFQHKQAYPHKQAYRRRLACRHTLFFLLFLAQFFHMELSSKPKRFFTQFFRALIYIWGSQLSLILVFRQ